MTKQTWLDAPEGGWANADFSIYNLPYGIFSTTGTPKRVGVAIGNYIIDMPKLARLGAFDGIDFDKNVFEREYLNDFMAMGKTVRIAVRQVLQQILEDACSPFKSHAADFLVQQKDAVLYMPVKVGDYTDFYSSEQHAYNVGVMFRNPQNALLPNWKHLPVAYHGRASSIFVSGTNFHRPKGQTCPDETQPPIFGPTKRLDIELEMATVIGKGNEIGTTISTADAEDHVFGFVLFNDWSARDIQKWEYVPLGPFLAKNFFSSVSPWVVTTEALEPFRVPAPTQTPEVLPYLQEQNRQNFDITLEVYLIPQSPLPPEGGIVDSHEAEGRRQDPLSPEEGMVTSQSLLANKQNKFSTPPSGDGGLPNSQFPIISSNFKNMYWTVAQQIAHHTINGCNLNIGDMLASGTISGKEPNSFGSLLELTWGGKNPIKLSDGSERKFLEDYDTIIIKGYAQKGDIRVGFGEVRTTVLPTKD